MDTALKRRQVEASRLPSGEMRALVPSLQIDPVAACRRNSEGVPFHVTTGLLETDCRL